MYASREEEGAVIRMVATPLLKRSRLQEHGAV